MNFNIEVNSTALNVSWSAPDTNGVQSYFATVTSAARNTSTTIDINSGIGVFPNYFDQFVVFGGLFPYTDYCVTVGGEETIGMGTSSLNTAMMTVRTEEGGKTNHNIIIRTTWLVTILHIRNNAN